MPHPRLPVRIFVGSPNDIADHRSALISTIVRWRSVFLLHGLDIEAFDYLQVPPEAGLAQPMIDNWIRDSFLVVLVFGRRTGPYTRHELDLVRTLHAEHGRPSLFVYFRQEDPALVEPELRELRMSLEPRLFFHEFVDKADLVAKLDLHLMEWIVPLSHLERVNRAVRRNQELFATMASETPPFTDEIVDLESHAEGGNKLESRAHAALEGYLGRTGPRSYDLSPIDSYLISRQLFGRIMADDPQLLGRSAFVFPIHQFLAHRIRSARTADPDTWKRATDTLQRWLTNHAAVYRTARDFAAFQLGMSRVDDARYELLDAVANPDETREVRHYGALALGMIRRRDTLPRLIELFDGEVDPRIRLVLGHAVLRVGHLVA